MSPLMHRCLRWRMATGGSSARVFCRLVAALQQQQQQQQQQQLYHYHLFQRMYQAELPKAFAAHAAPPPSPLELLELELMGGGVGASDDGQRDVMLKVNRMSTSHVTRHTSHVTRHTSHVTRHTSHVTRHTLPTCLRLLRTSLPHHTTCPYRCCSAISPPPPSVTLQSHVTCCVVCDMSPACCVVCDMWPCLHAAA